MFFYILIFTMCALASLARGWLFLIYYLAGLEIGGICCLLGFNDGGEA